MTSMHCVLICSCLFFWFLYKSFLHCNQSNSGEIELKHKPKMERGGMRAALFVYGKIFRCWMHIKTWIFFSFLGLNFVYGIAVSTVLESIAFIGNALTLFVYFYGSMNFSLTKSATMLTNYMGSTYLLSLLGGFICDTYLTRFNSSVIFGLIEVLVSTLICNNRAS